MNVSLVSSYTQLSTAPAVALQPLVFTDLTGVVHHARIVGVKGEGFAVEVHLLQFGFVVPSAIFNCEVDVRGVGTGGVGEDA